jgi:rod shape-determining protein MreC
VQTTVIWVVLELIAAWQVRTPEGTSMLLEWVRAVARPVTWTAREVATLTMDIGRGTSNLAHVIVDNRRLGLEVEKLTARNMLLEEDRIAREESEILLASSATLAADAIVARCAYRDLAGGTMEVRTAAEAHLPRDTPAITAAGLAGRVVRSEGRRHWLQLITHGAAAAAVQSEDTAVQGLVVGSGSETLIVTYVARQARLERGQLLITSGGDGIFPPGIPAATITRIRETDEPFLEIRAEPAADLRSSRVVLLLRRWSPLSGGGDE